MIKIPRSEIKYLTCGLFDSNTWSRPKAYKIYSNKIESDASGNYWSQRFSEKGYQFQGEKETINSDAVKLITEVLGEIPAKCFDLILPSPNTPGNKDEYEIYIAIELMDGNYVQFKVDEYDERDMKIDADILAFKERIKETIKLIEERG